MLLYQKGVICMWQAVKDSGVMDSTAVAEASHVASKVSAAVKEAAHTIQGAMSVVYILKCIHHTY